MKPRNAGLTLIEAMLAIVILAMVATMTLAGVQQTSRARSAIVRDTDRYHMLRVAMERMTRELQTAFVSAHMNISPSLQAMKTCFIATSGASFDRIDFTSFSHQRLYRNAIESDQNELSYFVTRHPDDSSMQVLARREDSLIDDQPQRGGKVEIVLEDVRSFELEYLDGQSGEWVDTWDSTQVSAQPNRLPIQVKITLGLRGVQNRDRTETFGTRVIIPTTWALNHAIYNP